LVASIDRAVAGVPAAQRPQLEWQMLSEPLQALAPPLPSAIRAALIARLASVPGVTTLAGAKDSLGRKADGFAIENDGVRSRLAFDPKTSVLLESSAVVARDGSGPYGAAKVGALLYRYRLVRTSVVDRLPPK
jgi:hypothetical protein